MDRISRTMFNFWKSAYAPDGYVVEFVGKDYRDEISDLYMLLNDYEGYEIVEVNQMLGGTKKRLHFLLADK